MAKRTVTRIGNIFSVKFPDNTKGYFQYVTNDLSQLNSQVIRVFYTHYPMDEDPEIEEIIKDKVQFYAHTFIRAGINVGAWEKYGTSKEVGENELRDVIFGDVQETEYINGEIKVVDPLKNWYLWRIGMEFMKVGELPNKLLDVIFTGSVEPYCEIVDRMYYGYYRYTMSEYKVLKRIPRPDVHSYVKFEEDGKWIYLCFWGDNLEKGAIVEGNRKLNFSESINSKIYKKWKKRNFSDYRGEHRNFITEDEFNSNWNQ